MIRPSSLVLSEANYNNLPSHETGNTENNLKNGEAFSKNASSSLTQPNDQSQIHQNRNQANRGRTFFQRQITTNAVASSSNSHGNGNSNIDEISNKNLMVSESTRERLQSVHNEILGFDHGSLKKIPVYYANLATRGHYVALALGVMGIRQHGYVMAGQPGKGRKSGAVLYSGWRPQTSGGRC